MAVIFLLLLTQILIHFLLLKGTSDAGTADEGTTAAAAPAAPAAGICSFKNQNYNTWLIFLLLFNQILIHFLLLKGTSDAGTADEATTAAAAPAAPAAGICSFKNQNYNTWLFTKIRLKTLEYR